MSGHTPESLVTYWRERAKETRLMIPGALNVLDAAWLTERAEIYEATADAIEGKQQDT